MPTRAHHRRQREISLFAGLHNNFLLGRNIAQVENGDDPRQVDQFPFPISVSAAAAADGSRVIAVRAAQQNQPEG